MSDTAQRAGVVQWAPEDEPAVGEPSRWNTLRTKRVLDGWEAGK